MKTLDPSKGWYSAQELEGLPGMPGTYSAVIRSAKKNLWACRPKVRGKGLEYALRALPEVTQKHIIGLFFTENEHDENKQGSARSPVRSELQSGRPNGANDLSSGNFDGSAGRTAVVTFLMNFKRIFSHKTRVLQPRGLRLPAIGGKT